MKRKVLFNAACLLVFLAAVGFTFQQPTTSTEPKAETQFKNIQIFKGMPASVVRPAMDGMTAALGVRCGFCHVQDAKGQWQFDKDDKEEKKTAREMFTMMNKINADNFNSNMAVTCATCHQGHSSPNRIPPIGKPATDVRGPAGSGGVGTADSMPKADDLIAKYEVAIGGQASVDKIKTVTMKSTIKSDEFNATAEIAAKSPNMILKTLTFNEGVFTQGFDGTAGWQKFGPNVEPVNGSELASLKGSSPLNYINPKLAYSNFRRVRKDTLDGKDVYVVDVQPGDDGMRIRLYFDATTNLLSRVWYGTQTVVGLVPATEDYSDYRDVAGVKMPFKLVDTNGQGVQTTEFSEIKVNVDVPDLKFSKPK
jgi:hypothetical protein